MPRAEETVSVEVAEVVVEDSVTLEGLSVAVARPDGTVVVRLTVPANPLDPATKSVEVSEDPELIVSDTGLADMLYPGAGAMTATLAEREVDELLAVTMTL